MKRMVDRFTIRRVVLVCVVIALTVGVSGFVIPSDSDYFFKINKSINVFGRVYKEIAANYVDEVDPERFMQAGIEGLLGTLDPYTVYIDKEDSDEVDLLTHGKYGGIGVTIGKRGKSIQVLTVMDGYSAQRQGVLPGDRILQVDGIPVGKRLDNVRTLTRGEPGTEVRVLIEREGELSPIEFVLIREEIKLRNVTYSDYVDEEIAYIRLERFSRRTGEEVRQAIKALKLRGEFKGLVLDLRGNPGGLLDAAVDVVSKFVPKGSLIVSTKGRRSNADKRYLSVEEPLVSGVPMIVLTDHSSASASEIVAGSLQDLDRALVVGTRTFGKGLVQTILPLNYGAQLKITTARYYIPSGRSIQEIDYMDKDGNGVFTIVPDSLKREFKTANGRTVHEYGGITPDSTVEGEELGPMVKALYRKSLFFKFSNKFTAGGYDTSFTKVTGEILETFREFLEEENFDYQEECDETVKELKQIAERSHYSDRVLKDLDLLASALAKEKDRGFDRYIDRIRQELNVVLMERIAGEKGKIEASLEEDVQLEVAIGVLKDSKVYERKINP
ncbi:MAG: S41 family peptidase [Ignavibacteria bacterium]|nr:S41 family peptidase [Ignavibacteria bacterium]